MLARLLDLADDHTESQPMRSGLQWDPSQEGSEQGGLTRTVRSENRDPLRPPDLQIDRSEREVAPSDHRAGEPRHDRSGTGRGRDFEAEVPRLPRLLDDIEPV